MEVSKENFYTYLPSLCFAASELKGSSRRIFLGQLALDIGKGGRTLVSKHLGISRETLRKGIREVAKGQAQEDKFSERGRKPLEETHPALVEQIKKIVDGASQTDPDFRTTRLYTRLSPKVVLEELIKQGYQACSLPCKQTIGNLMKRLGYKRRKVAKTKPKKKLKKPMPFLNS